MPKIKGQENRRFTDFFTDQHGREYLGNCEIGHSTLPGVPPTTDPIDLVPHGWTAPITPVWAQKLFLPPLDDHEIVSLLPRAERAKKGYQIHINYVRWLQKHDERTEQWTQHLRDIVNKMSGGVNALQLLREPPPELVDYIGPLPFPPRELIQAMAAGNEWALGMSADIPAKAAEMLEKLRPAVMRSRQTIDLDTVTVDPFADEAKAAHDAKLEALMDMEEDADPFATGGKVVAVGKRGRK